MASHILPNQPPKEWINAVAKRFKMSELSPCELLAISKQYYDYFKIIYAYPSRYVVIKTWRVGDTIFMQKIHWTGFCYAGKIYQVTQSSCYD